MRIYLRFDVEMHFGAKNTLNQVFDNNIVNINKQPSPKNNVVLLKLKIYFINK